MTATRNTKSTINRFMASNLVGICPSIWKADRNLRPSSGLRAEVDRGGAARLLHANSLSFQPAPPLGSGRLRPGPATHPPDPPRRGPRTRRLDLRVLRRRDRRGRSRRPSSSRWRNQRDEPRRRLPALQQGEGAAHADRVASGQGPGENPQERKEAPSPQQAAGGVLPPRLCGGRRLSSLGSAAWTATSPSCAG